MTTNDDVHANRKYKDTLFRKLFGEDKRAALSLYNALNNSNYSNEDDFEFTTLEDVIWMKVKNDVSFMVSRTLNLYEHQSSFNPNMPLRGFLYFADLYRKIIPESEKLYSQNLLKIPTPKYFVFFNGESKMEGVDRKDFKLSDAFEDPSVHDNFEWTATMININYGHNAEIMKRCKTLSDYSKFVETVRKYQETEDFKDAVNLAADKCIRENVLKDFLVKHRREVNDMCLTEFDEKKYEQIVRNDERTFTIFNLVQKGKLTPAEGAEELEMTLSDFERAMVNAGYKLPDLA